MADGKAKLWGGRFTGGTDPLMWEFNQCLSFDKTLYSQDIRNSIAYSLALSKTNPPILTGAEVKLIYEGFQQVLKEWEDGTFVIKPETDEDIHTANERRLCEIIGNEVGGKVHTGRSRNDQVATDVRLWLYEETTKVEAYLKELIGVIVRRAEQEIDHIMPGYTHLQRAQPIRWSHFLLSHAQAFKSDLERLISQRPRISTLPLSAGALAGNPFCVDTSLLAEVLGFERVLGNSMHAVGDRDFIVEFVFFASLLMSHISKLSEDLIIYSTAEFGFVTIGDAYSTGSSIMPQKKNADSLELLRGKSGRVFGSLSGLMMTLKGIPSTYDKDLQEDKEPLFDACRTVSFSLQILTGVLSTLSINPEKMKAALTPDLLATDLAEYLVRKGVPFRVTHHISGRCVALAEQLKVPMNELSVQQFKEVDERFGSDVKSVFDYERSAERRDGVGGTSRRRVLEQVNALKELVGI